MSQEHLLIISGKVEDKSNLYLSANEFVKKLQKNDYDLDEKNKNAILTDVGIDKIEKLATQKNCLKIIIFMILKI